MLSTHTLFQKIDGRSINLVITIASDAIRASIFYFETGKVPRVLAHTHQDMPVQEFSTVRHLHEQMLALLPALCDDISKKAQVLYEIDDLFKDHQRIHNITVLFASPWTDKHVSIQKESYDKYTTITQEVIDELSKQEEIKNKTNIDTYTTSAKINGYEVGPDNLLEKTARSLEVSLVASYVETEHIDSVSDVLETQFNMERSQIIYRPFSSALFAVVPELYQVPKDRIFLYMHAHYIDVFVFNNSQMVGYSSLNYGYQEVTNQIYKRKLGFTTEQARSLVTLFIEGHLEESLHNEIKQIIDTEVQVMNTLISQDTEEMSHVSYVPHDWYIICDNQLMNIFSQSIKHAFSANRIVLVDTKQAKHIIDLDQSDQIVPGSVLAGLYVQETTRV